VPAYNVEGGYVMEKSLKGYVLLLWCSFIIVFILTGCPEIKNMMPVSKAEASPDSGMVGQTIYLYGDKSYDSDGEIISYNWSFEEKPYNSVLSDNDINGRDSMSASFMPDVTGTFVVILRVTDDAGAVDTVSLSINIFSGEATSTPVTTATPVSTAASTSVPTSTPTAVPTSTPTAVATATPGSTPAAPSSLSVVANSPSSIRLTWTDNATNETGFEIQREHTTLSGTWVTVTQANANATYYNHNSLSETWPGYRIRAVNDAGASAWTQVTYAPPKLRIINDLYNNNGVSGDWGQLNNIVRVRIASTESQVLNDSTNTYERLCRYDSVSDITYTDWISPSYTSASTYEDFSVSTYSGIGTNYWIFIQCGWWEYDAVLTYSWIKRVSNVLCSDGSCCCYKWVTISCTHYAGYLVINASSFLPHGSWNGSL
jgi:hypothetical protein